VDNARNYLVIQSLLNRIGQLEMDKANLLADLTLLKDKDKQKEGQANGIESVE
jgi:hypothetical protein